MSLEGIPPSQYNGQWAIPPVRYTVLFGAEFCHVNRQDPDPVSALFAVAVQGGTVFLGLLSIVTCARE